MARPMFDFSRSQQSCERTKLPEESAQSVSSAPKKSCDYFQSSNDLALRDGRRQKFIRDAERIDQMHRVVPQRFTKGVDLLANGL